MRLGALAIVVFALTATAAASGARVDRFTKQVLVTDRSDAHLVNPWGLAASREGPWWVANEGRSTSTLYSGEGRKQALTVTVPGGPTGVVFNGGRGFVVRGNGASGPARFIYACEDGMIRAWTPTVPRGWSRLAVVAVDTGASGALFRGVTLARGKLYATDFHNDRILVFDSNWRRVDKAGAFVDREKPDWYAPFGIQAIGDRIFVTYAFRAPGERQRRAARRLRRRVRPRRAAARARRHARTSWTSRGASRSRRAHSGASAAISSSRTSAAAGSTRTGGSATAGRSGAGCR